MLDQKTPNMASAGSQARLSPVSIPLDNATAPLASFSQVDRKYLCLYGHFYQPAREDPFTNTLPIEPGAAPFSNYNEKITSECYRPNAEAGNFDALSFDLGPTLAAWLEQQHPTVYQRIIA